MRHAFRFLLVLCLSVPAFAATTVAGLVETFKALTVGEGKSVSAINVSVGHLKVVLTSGTVSPVMAGDQQVGLFLNGSGTFTYETVDKDELTAVRYNAKHADVPVKGAGDTATITEPFKSVLLRGNGLPEVTGAAAAAPLAHFKELRELFDRLMFADPAEAMFVLQALNAPQSRAVRAEINGTDRPYVYLYDDVWIRGESLATLRRPQLRGNRDSNWLYWTPLSYQLIGPRVARLRRQT